MLERLEQKWKPVWVGASSWLGSEADTESGLNGDTAGGISSGSTSEVILDWAHYRGTHAARAEMVSTSHSFSWLPTVQLGPETDSLFSGLSWTLLTSTNEASPFGLVQQPPRPCGSTWDFPEDSQEPSGRKSSNQSWNQSERLLILMNPQSSWLQSDFGTLWESEEEVGE